MDARCQMHYAAFYIEGILKVFGDNAVFSTEGFAGLESHARCFLFRVIENGKSHNIAIDFHDPRGIDKTVLLWSDLYAKINFHSQISMDLLLDNFGGNTSEMEQHKHKIQSIPPSFGIRVFGLFRTISHIFFILRKQSIKTNKKVILDNLRMYLKRQPISKYFHAPFRQDYIFIMASIWHKSTAFVNLSRAFFIRACKANPKITFEGGLVDIGYECDYIPDLNQLKAGNKKIKLAQYIKKTQQSNFVFNTPSVEHCHGWKLGEYLCMGKAIVSTPLSNDLPYPLEHGKHIHFVEDNPESIKQAVDFLVENPKYVKMLEKGALAYWKNYATPEKIIEMLVSKLIPIQ